MEQLGGGSIQSAVWTYKRSAARRFTTRAQARDWIRWNGRYLTGVEAAKVPIGPLRDRTDELQRQPRLFD